MRKIAAAAIFVLLFTSSRLAHPQAAPETRIEVTSAGKTTALIELQQARLLKISAGTIKYDGSTDTITLTGNCAVTLVQDTGHSLRFRGEKVTVKAQQIEVQLDGGYPIDWPNKPIEVLSSALLGNNKLPLFRVNWGFSMGSFGSSGTVLYDRKKQTLTEFGVGGDETSSFRNHTIYSGVIDEILHKMAKYFKQYEGTSTSGPFSFSALNTVYGLKTREIT